MKKERVVVVCPGRGTYNSDELGYLKKFKPQMNDFFSEIDSERTALGQVPITELDSAGKFRRSLHTKGENASGLIFACAYADFQSINRDKYDIVAVTGNSMGWYIALACAGALSRKNSFKLINTMGSMMAGGNVGGQVIYPIMNEAWQHDAKRLSKLRAVMKEINNSGEGIVHDSIYLGGNIVLGADANGVKLLLKKLEAVKIGRVEYPFQLINHAAFHTPLLKETSKKAFASLSQDLFKKANLPTIDGLGNIWQPYASDLAALRDYTLGHQVHEAYDFSAAIATALKEFAPDKLVLLGPGGSLGSSIAQVLIENKWQGIKSKEDFVHCQKENVFLLSMGRESERKKLL
jgi:acyl transferase domain-containing protein